MFRVDINFDLAQRQRMAQRDEAVGTFGGHNAGEPGGAEHVTFHRIALKDEIERFLPHKDTPFCDGDTLSRPLFGNIDHPSFASLVDVSEDAWGRRWNRIGVCQFWSGRLAAV